MDDGLLQRVVVVEAVGAIPAVALFRNPLPGLDQRPVECMRPQPGAGAERADLGVAPVVVDVGVGDQHLGDPLELDPELGERGSDVVRDRPGDPGVEQERALVAADQPLGEPAGAEA